MPEKFRIKDFILPPKTTCEYLMDDTAIACGIIPEIYNTTVFIYPLSLFQTV